MNCTRTHCKGTIYTDFTQDGPEDRCLLCGRAPENTGVPLAARLPTAPLARCSCGFHPRSEASKAQHQVRAHGDKPTARYRQGPQVVLGKTDRQLWVQRP